MIIITNHWWSRDKWWQFQPVHDRFLKKTAEMCGLFFLFFFLSNLSTNNNLNLTNYDKRNDSEIKHKETYALGQINLTWGGLIFCRVSAHPCLKEDSNSQQWILVSFEVFILVQRLKH